MATIDRAIAAFGGAELLREAGRVVGLAEELDECLKLKKRARGLSDTEFVVGMAESIALGASCLDDLAVNRADGAQTQPRGFEVPAPQRAGRWLRRFTLATSGGEDSQRTSRIASCRSARFIETHHVVQLVERSNKSAISA